MTGCHRGDIDRALVDAFAHFTAGRACDTADLVTLRICSYGLYGIEEEVDFAVVDATGGGKTGISVAGYAAYTRKGSGDAADGRRSGRVAGAECQVAAVAAVASFGSQVAGDTAYADSLHGRRVDI